MLLASITTTCSDKFDFSSVQLGVLFLYVFNVICFASAYCTNKKLDTSCIFDQTAWATTISFLKDPTLHLSSSGNTSQTENQSPCGCQLALFSIKRHHRYGWNISVNIFCKTQQRNMPSAFIKLTTLQLLFGALTD